MKIISGAQTGADRAALDAAIALGIPHGGWCPKGRRSESGPIPAIYNVFDTPSSGYPQRTDWNVRDSDGTVIFTLGAKLTGGSAKTAEFATRRGKPWLHVSRATCPDPAAALRSFASTIVRVNFAGSRESKEPGIHAWVTAVVTSAFQKADSLA